MSTSWVDPPWFPMARDPANESPRTEAWDRQASEGEDWRCVSCETFKTGTTIYYIILKCFIVLCYIYIYVCACVCVNVCVCIYIYMYALCIYVYSHAGISANESKPHKWVHPRYICRLLVLPLKPCVILQQHHDSPWRCQGWHHLWSMSGAAARLVDVVIGSDSKPFQ